MLINGFSDLPAYVPAMEHIKGQLNPELIYEGIDFPK